MDVSHLHNSEDETDNKTAKEVAPNAILLMPASDENGLPIVVSQAAHIPFDELDTVEEGHIVQLMQDEPKTTAFDTPDSLYQLIIHNVLSAVKEIFAASITAGVMGFDSSLPEHNKEYKSKADMMDAIPPEG
jgi:hypothetical protein